jgi:hypothetical protein
VVHASLALVSLAAGCAEPYEPLVCASEPTDELAFGFQVMASEAQLGDRVVMYENGGRSLFITEDCRYFAFTTADAPAGAWSGTRSGLLTPEQLDGLNRELLTRPFGAVDGERSSETRYLDGGFFVVRRDDLVAQCSSDCVAGSGELRHLREVSEAWIDRLHDTGAPLEGPMRVAVSDGSLDPGFPVVRWEGEPSLETIFAESEPWRSGGHRRIDDPVFLGLVRAELARALAEEPGAFWLRQHLGFVDGEGREYRLFARDALPFEDERGLVWLQEMR